MCCGIKQDPLPDDTEADPQMLIDTVLWTDFYINNLSLKFCSLVIINLNFQTEFWSRILIMAHHYLETP